MEAGVGSAAEWQYHRQRTDRAVDELRAGAGSDWDAMQIAIDEATERGAKTAAAVLSTGPPRPAGPGPPRFTSGSGQPCVADVGEADGESRQPRRGGGVHLQHQLLRLQDGLRVRQVIDGLASSEPHDPSAATRRRRLADLAGRCTNHDWLWSINPAHGFVLSPESFVTALRLRLGLPVATYAGPLPCGECGRELNADQLGQHALLCARGCRVLGHNALRDHVAALARISDSSTVVEASIQGRRPADILTGAAPLGGLGWMALDVGVTTPFTSDAARSPTTDVLDEYRKKKLIDYGDSCSSVGWEYRPLIFSAFGRAHEDTHHVIHRLCVAAAKSFGGTDVTRAEAAWWRNAGTLLAERAARMVERCRPVLVLPPVIGGTDEAGWDVEPSRARHRATAAVESLVDGADAPARQPSAL